MSHQLDHVIDARPDLITAAPVIRALRERGVSQRIVHLGQHDDEPTSDAFFGELDFPAAVVYLGARSGTHGEQTAATMVGLETAWAADAPELVVVYGDGNGALAASLAAAKLQVASAHVEAGLRSFDRSTPEEMNRIVSDLLGSLLFTTSPEANDLLRSIGVPTKRIRFVGNPMIAERIADAIVDWLAARERELVLPDQRVPQGLPR